MKKLLLSLIICIGFYYSHSEQVYPVFEANTMQVSADTNGAIRQVRIFSELKWNLISTPPSWITLSTNSGVGLTVLTITIANFKQNNQRDTSVFLYDGFTQLELSIIQKGTSLVEIKPYFGDVFSSGGEYKIAISIDSSSNWFLEPYPSWFNISTTLGKGISLMNVTFSPNLADTLRSHDLLFYTPFGNKVVRIFQLPNLFQAYIPSSGTRTITGCNSYITNSNSTTSGVLTLRPSVSSKAVRLRFQDIKLGFYDTIILSNSQNQIIYKSYYDPFSQSLATYISSNLPDGIINISSKTQSTIPSINFKAVTSCIYTFNGLNVQSMPLNNNTTITGCGQIIADNGGLDYYTLNSNSMITILPSNTYKTNLQFSFFEISRFMDDSLFIYDGLDEYAPVLYSNSNYLKVPLDNIYTTNQKAALTVRLKTNSVYKEQGFLAKIQCLYSQTIVGFTQLPDVTLLGIGLTITLTGVTATSGLPVGFSVAGPASIQENILSISSIGGIITLTAYQLGNEYFYKANPIVYVFEASNLTNIEKKNQKLSFIDIFPNPTKDELNILSNEKFDRIEIYDIYNSMIYSSEFKKNISLKKLETGTYIIILISDKNIFKSKFIKV